MDAATHMPQFNTYVDGYTSVRGGACVPSPSDADVNREVAINVLDLADVARYFSLKPSRPTASSTVTDGRYVASAGILMACTATPLRRRPRQRP